MSTYSEPLIDAIGVHHHPVTAPARIVSLVPSITELLFALELGPQIVGRTHYCIHPAAELATVPSVGGTKKIKHKTLTALNPTHVILNIDENTRLMAQRIAEYVPHVIVTHPLRPRDNLDLYRLLGGLFGRRTQAEILCRCFRQALTALERKTWPQRRVLYLIWRKPWMAVSPDTYISRTLDLIGWQTLPAQAEQRYPVVEMNRTLLVETDLILFSTEPYRFQEQDLILFARDYHYPLERLMLIDGEMTSWYGSRAITGLNYLRNLAYAEHKASTEK